MGENVGAGVGASARVEQGCICDGRMTPREPGSDGVGEGEKRGSGRAKSILRASRSEHRASFPAHSAKADSRGWPPCLLLPCKQPSR